MASFPVQVTLRPVPRALRMIIGITESLTSGTAGATPIGPIPAGSVLRSIQVAMDVAPSLPVTAAWELHASNQQTLAYASRTDQTRIIPNVRQSGLQSALPPTVTPDMQPLEANIVISDTPTYLHYFRIQATGVAVACFTRIVIDTPPIGA